MGNEGVPITAHAYRDNGRWALSLELPRWLARDVQATSTRFRITHSSWPGGTSRADEPVLMTVTQDCEETDARRSEVAELSQLLKEWVFAERDENAEVGRAIRGLRPRRRHHHITLEVQVGHTGAMFYRIVYTYSADNSPPFTTGSTVAHKNIADAIREYNEGGD